MLLLAAISYVQGKEKTMFEQLSKKFSAINPLESTNKEAEAKPKAEETPASFPPMSASAPPKPFGVNDKLDESSNKASFPPMSSSAPSPFSAFDQKKPEQSKPDDTDDKKDTAPEKKDGPMGFGGMFSSLPSSSPSPFGNAPTTKVGNASSAGQKDYHKMLTEFYQKNNPDMLSKVNQNLEKYKGKEEEMFQKLAQKYKTTNPMDGGTSQQAPAPSFAGFGASLPGASKASPFGSTPATQASPFGTSQTSTSTPFGTSSSDAKKSIFGSSNAAPSTSPFSSNAAPAPSSFSSNTAPAPSPFGRNAVGGFASNAGGFGSNSATQAPKFGGRNPRDLLVSFYQTHNPAKLGEVDKTLTKYAGKEEQLFINLAKKYNVDPAQFGVSAQQATQPQPSGFASSPAAPAFGSQSGFGTPSFGSPGVLGGGAPLGSGGFGSSGSGGFGSTSNAGGGFASVSGGSTFGSLAAGGNSTGFGGTSASFANTGFGGSSPFGAARR